jgi:acetyltransferase-like isoleucine patch superfamily enzyme
MPLFCTRAIARLRSLWWAMRLHLNAQICGGRLELAPTVRLRTRVVFGGRGTLRIGDHTTLGDRDAGRPGAPIFLSARHTDSWIGIGARSRLANGVEMIALGRIELGERILVGAGVRILDGDFHGIAHDERDSAGRSAPVKIGDGAWLGMSAMILKGVSIGDNAVVGAGSVVVRDVRAGAVVSGNPARVLTVYAEA